MFFRRTSTEMAAAGGENRADLNALARTEPAPGLLAYDGARAMAGWGSDPERASRAWCARGDLKPVDDLPAWSVVCFYVARRHRGEGIARVLLEGAVAYARLHGAPAVEGCARDARGDGLSPDSAYTGTVALFERADPRGRPLPATGRCQGQG